MTDSWLPTLRRTPPQNTAAPGRASAGTAERRLNDRHGPRTGRLEHPMTAIHRGGHAPTRLALSKVDAADALGVSVDFFEDHVMSDLRIVRRGRRRLIPLSELHRWLEAN